MKKVSEHTYRLLIDEFYLLPIGYLPMSKFYSGRIKSVCERIIKRTWKFKTLRTW